MPARFCLNTMQTTTSVELKRDCAAVQIPAGNAITLPAGTAVDITQTLGGSYTIHAQGGLFRIAPQDADALGLERPAESAAGPTGAVNEQMVWDTLRTCFDPEIPVNRSEEHTSEPQSPYVISYAV